MKNENIRVVYWQVGWSTPHRLIVYSIQRNIFQFIATPLCNLLLEYLFAFVNFGIYT